MGRGICLSTGHPTAQQIYALWDRVAQFEDAASMKATRYVPHITFAAYDDVPEQRLADVARQMVSGLGALRITFTSIQYFDNDPMVLWAAPAVTPELENLHNRVHAQIDPSKSHPHYRPGNWTAHCTLGIAIAPPCRADALAFAAQPIAPFDVVFDRIDWISFPPVQVLGSVPLISA